MGRPLRSLLLFATLSFWLSSASAFFCISEVAYEYVMRGDPAQERSLPCCGLSGGIAAASQEERPLDGRATPATADVRPFPHEPDRTPILASGSPLPWRAYCARSSRLLQ